MGVARRVVPGHLHQLGGGHQGVRRRARRHRLHLVATPRRRWSGRGSAASRCCSCPTSISAATPPTRWACRSTRWWCGIRTSRAAASTREQRRARAADPVEGPLLGPHALHRRSRSTQFRKQHPGHPRHRASRSAVRRRAGGRRQRLDRVHHQARCKSEPGGIDLGRRHRDPPRQPARAARSRPNDRRLARSVRLPVLDDVPRVAEPPAVDARRAASTARSTTGSSCPTTQKHWTQVALDRMLVDS